MRTKYIKDLLNQHGNLYLEVYNPHNLNRVRKLFKKTVKFAFVGTKIPFASSCFLFDPDKGYGRIKGDHIELMLKYDKFCRHKITRIYTLKANGKPGTLLYKKGKSVFDL
jgi:hypothetical protein